MTGAATDALIRLGAPVPPEPDRWRPILRDVNRQRSGGVHALAEKEAKAAARMYKLLRKALLDLSVRPETIDVKVFSGAARDYAYNPRVMMCFHYCVDGHSHCALPTVYGRQVQHSEAHTDSRIRAKLVFAESGMRDAVLESYPLWTERLGSIATPTYPFPSIFWPAIEPRQLSAAKAANLTPCAVRQTGA